MQNEKDAEIERLLAIASQPAQTGDDNANEAERFVAHFNIKAGDGFVSGAAVYSLYKNWSEEPLSKRGFGLQFTKLFQRKKSDGVLYYALDPTPFDLSIENYYKIREELRAKREQYVRKRRERQQEAAHKTKPVQVPGTGEGTES